MRKVIYNGGPKVFWFEPVRIMGAWWTIRIKYVFDTQGDEVLAMTRPTEHLDAAIEEAEKWVEQNTVPANEGSGV